MPTLRFLAFHVGIDIVLWVNRSVYFGSFLSVQRGEVCRARVRPRPVRCRIDVVVL
jgi:hypothetical protein